MYNKRKNCLILLRIESKQICECVAVANHLYKNYKHYYFIY